jgi:serine/threonine-protein kinase HipA
MNRFEPGTPLLSVSMPIQSRPYGHSTTIRFFDGLLPEGQARAMLAYGFGLGSEDTFGLLSELGRDSAGAMVITLDGEVPPKRPTKYLARPVTDEEVADRIDQLRSFPLGVDKEVRVSLAGMQEKLLLTKLDAGWGLPINGAPSTHILKPESLMLRGAVNNEAFCMRLARNAGISVASCDPVVFGKRNVLIVERFDRHVADDGSVYRLHQEDMCQALGKSAKYEEAGGPTLHEIAKLLQRYGHDADLEHLVELVTLHVFLGNADAHGKNYGLLHSRDGAISLAPAYDVMSTIVYPDVSAIASMSVGGEAKIDAITVGDIEDEATRWGFSRRRAREIVLDVNDRLVSAIDQTAGEISPSDDMSELLAARKSGVLSQQDRWIAENLISVSLESAARSAGASHQELPDGPMCAAITHAGNPCPWHALPGKRSCGHHND